ncbi:hypothetical protein ACJMK2_005336 [Sinanodonta woodiana]|uniref:Uncharacterized protein n=1 Tax=Sinanodonta woodiana TaxID=1069815 RepID=A0ABD3VPR8_SINWO
MEIEENTDSNTRQATTAFDDTYEKSTDPKRSRSSKHKKMSFREEVMLKRQKLDSFLKDRKLWDVHYFSDNIKPFLQTLHVRNQTAGVSLAPLNHVPKKAKR